MVFPSQSRQIPSCLVSASTALPVTSVKLNTKVKQLARKSALTYKAKENGIIVLNSIDMKEAKTKQFMEVLSNMNLAYEKWVHFIITLVIMLP